ncbi:MAG: PaaX family transcriptional regulator C-terminal domain-containing protein, partial [Patescibacteria group bacterium]
ASAARQRESLISTVQRGGSAHMRRSSSGREVLLVQFPRSIFIKKKWDERWRVLIFRGVREFGQDYQDKDKKIGLSQEYRVLHGMLSSWGFMPLARGVYATPFPVDDHMTSTLAEAKKLKLLIGLETRRFLFGDEKEFVRQSWNLDFLSKQYAKLRTRVTSLLRWVERQNELNDSVKHQFSLLSMHIHQMLKSDPGLPAQLLPEDFQEE